MREIDRRLFRHRNEAGRPLATALTDYASRPNLSQPALPRGGVLVVAELLQGPSPAEDSWR